jgi:hypothetical protein
MLWNFLYSSDKNRNGGDIRNAYHRWKGNIEMDLTETTCECTDSCSSSQGQVVCSLEHNNESLVSISVG